ncbi:hypothetical protein BDB00DRAFT_872711 [Zychaea mexicana]|uniref:uncharacterized protein n=1 Tax=Zychaea mexicana TaxID=64656 RepID=UPI0022FE48B4|nr:uncharacterized protein BDB00DRAFT_872711 [Zychaea mexicana]KAI9493195.1 hypothetical protein BDB00DRAFT_872711 [Zychaea mexicana]
MYRWTVGPVVARPLLLVVEIPDAILPPPSHPPSASVPVPTTTTTSSVPTMQSTVSPSPLVRTSPFRRENTEHGTRLVTPRPTSFF